MSRPAPDEAREGLDMTMVLASAVHDAKNALGMMLGSLDDIAERCDASSGVPKALRDVTLEGARVNAALVRLLALYRMDSGHYRVTPVECDVDACLEECAIEHEATLAARGIGIEVETGNGLDWPLDPGLVSSVLQGAVNNACSYARSRIVLGARVQNGWLALRVADDGPGFPDALLEQGGACAPGLDRARSGTGLGLYFAARVAEAHRARDRRGYVTLENAGERGGAIFTLVLP